VLMGSFGIAWLLKQRGELLDQKANERCIELLADIRSKKLPWFWTQESVENWYLILDSRGGILGWQRDSRTKTPDGFEGESFRSFQGDISYEGWNLNEDATAGEYSGIVGKGFGETFTGIVLDSDIVTVRPGKSSEAVISDAPEDYVPEGLLGLFLREGAMEGKEFAGKMILDAIAIRKGKVNFTPFAIIPSESRKVEFNFIRGIKGRVYHFDEQGQIELIIEQNMGIIIQRVEAVEVLKRFPQARSFAKPGPVKPNPRPLQGI